MVAAMPPPYRHTKNIRYANPNRIALIPDIRTIIIVPIPGRIPYK